VQLDIVIPTINRQTKLLQCLNSIFQNRVSDPVTVYIYFSVFEELLDIKSVFEGYEVPIKLLMVEDYKVPTFWNHHLKHMTADAMVCINDDVLFSVDTLPTLIEEYKKQFPDYDGIMGLNQSNIPTNQALQSAFTVIGSKYADRFPDRQVWAPDYNRLWADKELLDYADSIGRFYFSRKTNIIHLHPAFGGQEDQTHVAVRTYLAKDKFIYQTRKELGYLWGRNFKLLNEQTKELV
jgi:hypothetical protein